MADELAKAVTRIIYPAVKPEGFRRAGKRDLIRVQNGIVHRLYFQVSGTGGRDFCVTACANLIAGCDAPVLTPGFRLTRDTDGGDLWLPSETSEAAERSAEVILGSIRSEALPYFDAIRTPAEFSAHLAAERWGSMHHLSFQRGVSAALDGDAGAAQRHLSDAVALYEAGGRHWCADYVGRANRLLEALDVGDSAALLTAWSQANGMAHGIR
jgi:hypothetical protein